jgi:hypothetical protein
MFVVRFEVLSCHLSSGTEENYEKRQLRIDDISAKIRATHLRIQDSYR